MHLAEIKNLIPLNYYDMFFVANNGNIQLNKLLLAQHCSSYYDLWISEDSGVFEIYDR